MRGRASTVRRAQSLTDRGEKDRRCTATHRATLAAILFVLQRLPHSFRRLVQRGWGEPRKPLRLVAVRGVVLWNLSGRLLVVALRRLGATLAQRRRCVSCSCTLRHALATNAHRQVTGRPTFPTLEQMSVARVHVLGAASSCSQHFCCTGQREPARTSMLTGLNRCS